MIWHIFFNSAAYPGQDMFLEKFHNKCVRIQYFVGNERVEAVGHLSAEDANFICLRERSQLIKISSITSVFEEPELTAEPEFSPIPQQEAVQQYPAPGFAGRLSAATRPLTGGEVVAAGAVPVMPRPQAPAPSAFGAAAVTSPELTPQEPAMPSVQPPIAPAAPAGGGARYPGRFSPGSMPQVLDLGSLFISDSTQTPASQTAAVRTSDTAGAFAPAAGTSAPAPASPRQGLGRLGIDGPAVTGTAAPATVPEPAPLSPITSGVPSGIQPPVAVYPGTPGAGFPPQMASAQAPVQITRPPEESALPGTTGIASVAGAGDVYAAPDLHDPQGHNVDPEHVFRSVAPGNFTLIKSPENIRKEEERRRLAEEKAAREKAEEEAAAEARRLAEEKEQARRNRKPVVVGLMTPAPAMFTVQHRAREEIDEVATRQPKVVTLATQGPLNFTVSARQNRIAELVKAASRALVNPLSEDVSVAADPVVDPMDADLFSQDFSVAPSLRDTVAESSAGTDGEAASGEGEHRLEAGNTRISVAMPIPEGMEDQQLESGEGSAPSVENFTEPAVQARRNNVLQHLIGNSRALVNEAVREARKTIKFAPPSTYNFVTGSGNKGSRGGNSQSGDSSSG